MNVTNNIMSRKEITKKLSDMLAYKINPNNDSRVYWAEEVTFDYYSDHRTRVDFMKFEPINHTAGGIEKGDFFCYEIKSSIEDFKSKHGHNFLGDFNYYVMPLAVFDRVKDQIPYGVGVYVPDNEWRLRNIKKAKRNIRERSAAEMLLMMFRSGHRSFTCCPKQVSAEMEVAKQNEKCIAKH